MALTLSSGKILPLDRLLPLRAQFAKASQRVVWTNGCFDLFHAGHLHGLRQAKSFGDVLIVGVNSDDSVRRLKGAGRPILPAEERAELLAALECVDYVIVFEDDTPERTLAELRPDVHTKGAEYAPPGGKPIPEAGLVAGYGGQIVFFEQVPGISTTQIIQRIRTLNPQ